MDIRTFRIFRYDSTKEEPPKFESFEVPVEKGMTVLEGLMYIQDNLDGSLAFRSSCRASVCGSCAMHINGKYRLACETQIYALKSKTITIRPMAHLKVIKDLFVDLEPFWEKYKLIKPFIQPGEPAPERERIQSADDRLKLEGLIDCILCGACHASCTVCETHPEYLGPAVLLKVNRFVEDSRDNAEEERLDDVSGLNGVFRCHTIFNCQEVCPKELDPTGSIANLKRKIIKKKFGLSRLYK
ncbi:succinate dehydrogenase/fumarate reductase iron-sulfur subunit [candidate division KSB1 bacterium]